jgi:hypothetical protein
MRPFSDDAFPHLALEAVEQGKDDNQGGHAYQDTADGYVGDDGDETGLALGAQISQGDEPFI